MTDRPATHADDDYTEIRLRIPTRTYLNYKSMSKNVGLAATQFMRTVLVDYDNRVQAKAEKNNVETR